MTSIIQIKNFLTYENFLKKISFNYKNQLVVCFTNCNEWYAETLAKNFLTSYMEFHHPKLEKIGVLCSDEKAFEKVKKFYEYCEYIDIPELEVNQLYTSVDEPSVNTYFKYTRLCFFKTVLTYYALKLGYKVFYLDPDMAFTRTCFYDLLEGKADAIFAGSPIYLNTNIMIVNPNENTELLFGVYMSYIKNAQIGYALSDEDFIRDGIKGGNKSKIGYLDEKKFPNGSNAKGCRHIACIIHANCVPGLERKIQLLKEVYAWYI